MLKFIARYIFFLIATFIIGYLIHFYYETILWFFTVKVSQILGPIAFSSPNIVNDQFVCRLENATLRFMPINIILGTFITIPLILATSNITLLNRAKMIMLGLALGLLFQSSYLLIVLYEEVYRNYHLFLQKGLKIDRIIDYTPFKAGLISWLYHFFNNLLQYMVAIGIWIGLVTYCKRQEKGDWIRKLF